MDEFIIGRDIELKQLQDIYESNEAQLVLVYGRRRVGKTFLINHFFNKRFDFKLTGDFKGTREDQLKNFHAELKNQTKAELPQPKKWSEAFWQLREYIENLSENEKHVVFFDEMPWLDTPKSDFLPAFEYFWNSYGSAKDNLIFIVCGSVTSWIVEKIERNKGGLFNRKTARIYLEPFNLYETEKFLEAKNIKWSRFTIIQAYMILGGIPYYLKLLNKELTFNANIDNLFFRKRAELWDEYDNLYSTLFSSSDKYTDVVETLSKKKQGYTRSEISEKTKIPDNSKLTKILKNLVDSGFIRAYSYFGKRKQNTFYQLADYFTLFYFKYVKDNYGTDEHFWSNSLDNPSRTAWEGFTFEQVCKDHFRQIKKKIGISGILCSESSWSIPKTEEHPGAQIDMLIDRRDKVISVCEIKFSNDKFQISKDYDETLRKKISVFKTVTKTNKSLQLVMITTYGLTNGMYSNNVQTQVVMDDLFENIKF